MDLQFCQTLVWKIGVVADVLLIGVMFRRDLVRHYPFFFSFLILQVTASVLLLQVEYLSLSYLRGWRWYGAAMIVIRVGVAAELFEHVSSHFVGIGIFRLWMGVIALALTGILAWGLFAPLHALSTPSYPQNLVLVIARWETLALAGALAIAWFFLTRFVDILPPIRDNVTAHWKLTVVYFLIDGIGCAAAVINAPLPVWLVENIVVLAVQTACIVGWLLLLTAEGQQRPKVHTFTAEEIEAIYRREEEVHKFAIELPTQIENNSELY